MRRQAIRDHAMSLRHGDADASERAVEWIGLRLTLRMPKTPQQLDLEKQLVAEAGVERVKDGMLLGLGSGSTARHFIRALAARLAERKERVTAVATSEASAQLALSLNIPVIEPERGMRLDLTVDGADEIGPALSLIKGGGGALLREKLVATNSASMLVISDSSKVRPVLGAFPLPLEVIPFATSWILDEMERLGGHPKLRTDGKGPLLSDQKNHLVDCAFGLITDPSSLARQLDGIPGIVEHGLFIGLAGEALVADGDTVMMLRPDAALPP